MPGRLKLRREPKTTAALSDELVVDSDDENEEDFVDAYEEPPQSERAGSDQASDVDDEEEAMTDNDGDETAADEVNPFLQDMAAFGAGDAEMTTEAEEAEADLFEATFGNKAKASAEGNTVDDDKDDKVGGGSVKAPQLAKGQYPNGYEFIKSEHTGRCNGRSGAATPPNILEPRSHLSTTSKQANGVVKTSAPAPPPAFINPGPRDIDAVRHLSPNFRAHERFHIRAQQLIPRLPLAKHRYWIAVLHLGRKPVNAREEKHFTWMKGNRLTTIETVWHTYQTATMAEDDFALMLGFERPDMGDTVEELDFFNDKFVVLRAVAGKEVNVKEIGEGVITRPRGEVEVVEID